jgi:hypothetical protein
MHNHNGEHVPFYGNVVSSSHKNKMVYSIPYYPVRTPFVQITSLIFFIQPKSSSAMGVGLYWYY